MGGGSCGCCGCPTDHKVERDFFVLTLPSADATIDHWDVAVGAGRNILWDALSVAMEKAASETMAEYSKALDVSERLMLNALNQQFEVLKQDKEGILQSAQSARKEILSQAERFSDFQDEILGQRILEKLEKKESR